MKNPSFERKIDQNTIFPQQSTLLFLKETLFTRKLKLFAQYNLMYQYFFQEK